MLVREWGGRQTSGDCLQPEYRRDVSSWSESTLSKFRSDALTRGNSSTAKQGLASVKLCAESHWEKQ